MFSSDLYDRDEREEAEDVAFEMLDDIVNTSYTPAKSNVTHTQREGDWFFMDFETDAVECDRARLEISVWGGRWTLSVKRDGEWFRVIDHD